MGKTSIRGTNRGFGMRTSVSEKIKEKEREVYRLSEALVVALMNASSAFLESALDRPACEAIASMSSALFMWFSVL